MKFLIIFQLMFLHLYANYCIQLLSTPFKDQTKIFSIAKQTQLQQFPFERVESRGDYLVLRVGDYFRYNKAKKDLKILKDKYKDAYIRKCDLNQESILFQSQNIATIQPKQQIKPDIGYKKVRPSTIEHDGLSADCQRCFTPLYIEE